MDTVVISKLATKIALNWHDNPPVKALLDVVIGIMAEEYIRVARENKDLFIEPGLHGNSNGR
jgi:hypothetical protein